MEDLNFYFSFKHRETGKIIIAQSWSEFYKLQQDHNYTDQKKLGVIEYCPNEPTPVSYDVSMALNRFWSGARGYEKIGELDCLGIPGSGVYNGIRNFLRNVHNQACMEGDVLLWKKVKEADSWFWHNNRIHQLALPCSK